MVSKATYMEGDRVGALRNRGTYQRTTGGTGNKQKSAEGTREQSVCFQGSLAAKSVVRDEFLVPLPKVKYVLNYCVYSKYFSMDRLHRYPFRVAYLFRHIAYLGPKLSSFSSRRISTLCEGH